MISNSKCLLGHAFVLQDRDSIDDPRQSHPPPDGAGFVHVRLLVWCPVPQVLVQEEYPPHEVHPPFTAT